jgi:hypothetical protein
MKDPFFRANIPGDFAADFMTRTFAASSSSAVKAGRETVSRRSTSRKSSSSKGLPGLSNFLLMSLIRTSASISDRRMQNSSEN